MVLPSEPKLYGKHTLDTKYSIDHLIHWHTYAQGVNDGPLDCPWGHF
jgi:hypothetical protein